MRDGTGMGDGNPLRHTATMNGRPAREATILGVTTDE